MSLGGKRVELLIGCERWGDRWTTLAALRRLVEQQGADIVIGAPWEGDGIALRAYAKSQPEVTFSLASFEQSATLKSSAPNVFRFVLDSAQASAGLGAYAFHALGWRRVVTIGEDDPSGWPTVAGFVAEFCSLGGEVVQRLWAPAASPALGQLAARIPRRGIDGVYYAGNGIQPSRAFVEAWGKRRRNLATSLVGGASVLFDNLGARMVGVVGVSPNPLGASRSWRRYTAALAKTFSVHDFQPFPLFEEHDAMEAVLEALAQVHGDLSHDERRFMKALAHITAGTSVGRVRLDRRHQAIVPVYLGTVAKDAGGRFIVRQVGVVPSVEQTFGGYFSPQAPAPSRTQPSCRPGRPPAWAKKSPVPTR